MNSSTTNNTDIQSKDGLDKLIFEKGLRIKNVWFDKEMDLIVVLLNNKKILKRPLSDFNKLSEARETELLNFVIDGIGIHWRQLDEDLSLKGFLTYEIEHIDLPVLAK